MENKVIDLEIIDDLEQSGVSAISLVEVPAIEKTWMAFKREEFVTPQSGERQDDFIPRCIAKLVGEEGYETDQAAAICYSTWRETHSEKFAKVSFDWNETLSTDEGFKLAKSMQNDELYIISAISEVNQKMLDRAAELGIPESRIFATGSNAAKVEKIKELGIDKHIDNSADVISELGPVGQKFQFAESYTDYPEAAKNAAQRALDWAEKNGWGSCGTPIGKARANQLAKGEPISEETIARMASFARHKQNSDTPYGEGCGKLMWDAWGGDAGIEWASRKLEQIREEMSYDVSALPPFIDELPKKKKFASEEYLTIEEAIDRSEELGLKGEIHSHATEDGFIYMPGASHADLEKALKIKSEEFAAPASGKPGDRPLARIPKEERGRTGSVKNEPGDTKTTRGGIEVSEEVEKTLKDKIEAHNKTNTQDSQKATLGMLKAVWRRGAGAYSVGTPGKRNMTRAQWAMARVNSFLNILGGNRSGYDKDYTQDNDLLPKGHPKHSEVKATKQFFSSEDQKIVVGPAMIPDMIIPRVDEDTKEKYAVRFSAETIAKIAEKFMRELRNDSTNVEHNGANGANSYVKETWIVETEDDKANTKYGLDVPVGTWMVAMRVQDPGVWKQIKAGQLNGFSIEGNFMDKKDYEQYQKDRALYNRVVKILKSI